MRLLDMGCGPGSITAGLAAAVAPGLAVGVDIVPVPVEHVCVSAADAKRLPFADQSFDAVFSCAMLQHVGDPAAVLRDARRVCRPGAAIAIVDIDWDFAVHHPSAPMLERGRAIMHQLRGHTSPRVGKQLRGLLHEAGFEAVTVSLTTTVAATAADAHNHGAGNAGYFEGPAARDRIITSGLATADELDEIAVAWRQWGSDPGAFSATAWFKALAWASR